MTTFTTRSTAKYSTLVILPNGKQIDIKFVPGVFGNHKEPSIYMTSDPDVIKALQEHPNFNERFFLDATEPAVDAQGDAPDDDNLEKISGITNKQMALDWLKENKQLELAATLKVEEIKTAAAEASVEFPDWSGTFPGAK